MFTFFILLLRHAGISCDQIHLVGREVENILRVPRRIITETSERTSSGADYGTGEERIYQIRQVLEELGRTLKKLPNLALRLNAVTGIDPTFRFSEVGSWLK